MGRHHERLLVAARRRRGRRRRSAATPAPTGTSTRDPRDGRLRSLVTSHPADGVTAHDHPVGARRRRRCRGRGARSWTGGRGAAPRCRRRPGSAAPPSPSAAPSHHDAAPIAAIVQPERGDGRQDPAVPDRSPGGRRRRHRRGRAGRAGPGDLRARGARRCRPGPARVKPAPVPGRARWAAPARTGSARRPARW